MGFLDKLTGIFDPVSGVIEGAKAIIGKFKLDPEVKKQMEHELLKLEIAERQKIREHERELEEAYLKDAADLRKQIKVELQSEDPFVRRARPAWLWGLLLMYFLNYGVGGVVNMFSPFVALDIPYEVHLLAGALVAGYGYLRTIEKRGAKPPFSR